MSRRVRIAAQAGFILLPVVLAMSLVAAISFLLNRDNGLNANLIGAESDHERARYAAEAGLQAVNFTIQGLGCAGTYPISSSPITDSNFGGATLSAYANNASGSPLTLTATGSYNGASVTLTKTNVYVYQAGVRTWVTQPGPTTGKDAMVNENSPTFNYGGAQSLEVDDERREVLIAFDLSPLPAGSRIVRWFETGVGLRPGASISLYQYGTDPRYGFSVMLVTHDWVAGTHIGATPTAANPGMTYNRWDGVSPNSWPGGAGAGYDPRPLFVVPDIRTVGWIVLDVTDAAIGWSGGMVPNYGVWLSEDGSDPNNDANDYFFRSSNYTADASLRPKFTAYYLLPCGASAP